MSAIFKFSVSSSISGNTSKKECLWLFNLRLSHATYWLGVFYRPTLIFHNFSKYTQDWILVWLILFIRINKSHIVKNRVIRRFDVALLIQSILMILTMLVMLEISVRMNKRHVSIVQRVSLWSECSFLFYWLHDRKYSCSSLRTFISNKIIL